MGDFRITIGGVGGHGQDRSKKHGEAVDFNEGGENTPDAIAKKCVDALTAAGVNVTEAHIMHWPANGPQIVDDLKTGKRTGSF